MMEVLVASLIIAVCIMGVMSLWAFSANVTNRNGNQALGYNLARRAVEKVRALGFNGAAEGTETLYYDMNGGGESSSRGSLYYSVTTTITSSPLDGSGAPAPNALRTVVVQVRTLSDNSVVNTAGTLMCRGGI